MTEFAYPMDIRHVQELLDTMDKHPETKAFLVGYCSRMPVVGPHVKFLAADRQERNIFALKRFCQLLTEISKLKTAALHAHPFCVILFENSLFMAFVSGYCMNAKYGNPEARLKYFGEVVEVVSDFISPREELKIAEAV